MNDCQELIVATVQAINYPVYFQTAYQFICQRIINDGTYQFSGCDYVNEKEFM